MPTPRATTPPGTVEQPPPNYSADPALASPVGRNRDERKRISTIEHRLDYLREQAADGTTSGWRDAERAALGWALRRIAEAERAEQATLTAAVLDRFITETKPGAPYRYITVYGDGNEPAGTLTLDGTVDLTREETDAILAAHPDIRGDRE